MRKILLAAGLMAMMAPHAAWSESNQKILDNALATESDAQHDPNSEDSNYWTAEQPKKPETEIQTPVEMSASAPAGQNQDQGQQQGQGQPAPMPPPIGHQSGEDSAMDPNAAKAGYGTPGAGAVATEPLPVSPPPIANGANGASGALPANGQAGQYSDNMQLTPAPAATP